MTTPTRPHAVALDLAGVREVLAMHLPVGPARLVVVAMSRDENPKAVVLAIPYGHDTPAVAAKVALTPTAAEAVRAEAAALNQLAALDPGRVGGTVPRCLGLHDTPAATVLVTTVAVGRPMTVGYHSWRHTGRQRLVTADFAAADQWLGRLSSITVPAGAESDLGERIAARWPHDDVAQLAAEACRRARRQVGPLRSGGVAHGDFWCGNLLSSKGAVSGVIDWEHARFGQPGLWDRVRFALAYTLYLDRHHRAGTPVLGHPGLTAGTWGEPVRHLLRSSGWYSGVVASFIGSSSGAPNGTPGWWRSALLVGLGEIAALSDHDEFAREHAHLLAEVGS
ncbi:MAG: aminoglycoside phosphotransferase family protein [Humibacillus sp.]|nr:aminoglycoside phosphotransferase family protein [Humibacillus sp.]MDN5775306.1 aminoglycoside phosphotransferase family protein [Humibacillus sp.]